MHIVASILTIAFMALMLSTAFTFAAGLLIAVLAFSVLLVVFSYARAMMHRIMFIHDVEERERAQTSNTVIEGEYRDVTDSKPKKK